MWRHHAVSFCKILQLVLRSVSQSSSLVSVPPQFQCSAIVKRNLALEEIRKEKLVRI